MDLNGGIMIEKINGQVKRHLNRICRSLELIQSKSLWAWTGFCYLRPVPWTNRASKQLKKPKIRWIKQRTDQAKFWGKDHGNSLTSCGSKSKNGLSWQNQDAMCPTWREGVDCFNYLSTAAEHICSPSKHARWAQDHSNRFKFIHIAAFS